MDFLSHFKKSSLERTGSLRFRTQNFLIDFPPEHHRLIGRNSSSSCCFCCSNSPEVVRTRVIRDPSIWHPEGPVTAPLFTPRILHEDLLSFIIVSNSKNAMSLRAPVLVQDSLTWVEVLWECVAGDVDCALRIVPYIDQNVRFLFRVERLVLWSIFYVECEAECNWKPFRETFSEPLETVRPS